MGHGSVPLDLTHGIRVLYGSYSFEIALFSFSYSFILTLAI
jgi:hypothetical protein